MQTIPIKPIPNENRNNSLDISKHEIKQTIPDNNTYTLKNLSRIFSTTFRWAKHSNWATKT
jgi:hypothetical protein